MSSDCAHDDRDPFFIVGTGRCGSTLLQRMLCAHPGIAIPPETHFFKKLDPILKFTDPLRVDEVEAYLNWLEREPHFVRCGVDGEAFARFLRAEARSARSICEWLIWHLAGEPEIGVRLGEKSPPHEKRLARIFEVFPEAKIVHIYRDPRDVVASLGTVHWGQERSALQRATFCRDVLRRALKSQMSLGTDRHMMVQYESLVGDPEGELRRLCAFLGESFHERMLAHHESGGEGATYREDERPFKGLTDKSIVSDRIARYRTSLSPREIAGVERTVGSVLFGQFGYELDAGVTRRMHWAAADFLAEQVRRLRREVTRKGRRRARRPSHKVG